jgi:glycosyltransferase involved in cell wall biosynthesis
LIIFNLTKSLVLSLPTIVLIKLFRYKTNVIMQFHGSRFLEAESTYSLSGIKYSIKTKLRLMSYQLVDQIAFNLVKRVVFFSEYAKKLVSTNFKINSSKLKVIRPGKSLSPLLNISNQKKAKLKKLLGLNANTTIILIMTRIEPRKGSLLIPTIIKQCKDISNTTFIICSSFEEPYDKQSQLFFTSLSKENIDTSYFLIHNPTLEKRQQLFTIADCVLMPSIDLETFGFVTLESLSFGKPVFAFNIGANPELIKHNYSGYLVKSISTQKMARQIKKFLHLTNKEKKSIAANALQTAKNFSWYTYSKGILQLINHA